MNNIVLILGVLLFFSQFIYSGINKIPNFNKKVDILTKKTNLDRGINEFGMISVILLEIIGSLIVISYFLIKSTNNLYKNTTLYVLIMFCIFLVVVTILYHPPGQKMIPFMSNITVLGGFILLIYILLYKQV